MRTEIASPTWALPWPSIGHCTNQPTLRSPHILNSQPSISEALGLRVQTAVAGLLAPLLPKAALEPLPRLVRPFARELERLSKLRDPRSLYAYCFCAYE